MKRLVISTVFLLLYHQVASAQVQRQKDLVFYTANHAFIQYIGRIDFSNSLLPRFWQPGVYIDFCFEGNECAVIINDEELYGSKHNYLEIVIDAVAKRIQTSKKSDTIVIATNAGPGRHSVQIVKNTEANIGWLEFGGLYCNKLFKPIAKPSRKIECIGNSITCGTGVDASMIPCGKGVWEDQHNAYKSYGAVAARQLNAQYHLSAVSGIGLMSSCCNMDITMPEVYDKVSMRNDSISWNFDSYRPNVITVCLGQNDGIQDSATYVNNYAMFLLQVRRKSPKAKIVCLSSPMADERLAVFMKKMLPAIVRKLEQEGCTNLSYYFFRQRYFHGCDTHPDMQEHQQMAEELAAYIKKMMDW